MRHIRIEDTPLKRKYYLLLFNMIFASLQKFGRAMKVLLWASICILGLAFALYLMNLVWIRFISTPTFTVLQSIHYPTYELEFPAVTICNTNKVYAPAVKVVKDKL